MGIQATAVSAKAIIFHFVGVRFAGRFQIQVHAIGVQWVTPATMLFFLCGLITGQPAIAFVQILLARSALGDWRVELIFAKYS